jgi:protein involved in polysaccharide export with SLBB domain
LQPGDIILLAAKPVHVDVRGDIKTPGTSYLSEGDTLAQAVAQAGGFASTTSMNAILLRRNGTEKIVSSAGPEFNGPARNGDVIVLRPAPHVSVVGMVEKPGDALLQNDASLMSALYQAGGPAQHADLAHVKITRAGQEHTYNISRLMHGDVSQNVPVYDGDVIVVPKGRTGINFDAILGTLGGLASLQLLLGH